MPVEYKLEHNRDQVTLVTTCDRQTQVLRKTYGQA